MNVLCCDRVRQCRLTCRPHRCGTVWTAAASQRPPLRPQSFTVPPAPHQFVGAAVGGRTAVDHGQPRLGNGAGQRTRTVGRPRDRCCRGPTQGGGLTITCWNVDVATISSPASRHCEPLSQARRVTCAYPRYFIYSLIHLICILFSCHVPKLVDYMQYKLYSRQGR